MLALAALLATVGHAQQPAADVIARAALLRAMVVLKIVPYLTFPAAGGQAAEFRIGVVGDDDVATAMLKELPGKKLGDRTVAVTAVAPEAAAKAKPDHGCDLLWIAGSIDATVVQRIVDGHRGQPVVLVADRPGFATDGGGLQLFVVDNSVKFEANVDALKRQGVRADPQLLKMSRKGPGR